MFFYDDGTLTGVFSQVAALHSNTAYGHTGPDWPGFCSTSIGSRNPSLKPVLYFWVPSSPRPRAQMFRMFECFVSSAGDKEHRDVLAVV